MAAPAHAGTISRAAEILGEDEELLWDMATDMGPEDGRLWIYDTDDQQTVAFTHAGMEYLREIALLFAGLLAKRSCRSLAFDAMPCRQPASRSFAQQGINYDKTQS